jgi:hypothetical protein
MQLLALALTLLLPMHGVLVVGKSLGGVRLGMTHAQVQQAWGTRFSRCRGCPQETWYFTYRRFHPEGGAVRFRRGHVDAVWTLWKPPGWRTHEGDLRTGSKAVLINAKYGALVSIPCGTYRTLILTRRQVTTVFYIYGEDIWGFGLQRPGDTPCR